MHTEEVRQPSRQHAIGIPCAEVRIDHLRVRIERPPVIAVGNAEIHAGSRSGEVDAGAARVFERFPCHFEHEALLRIHGGRFARRDAEELRIEAVDAIEEGAIPRNHLSGRVRIRIVKVIERPAFRGNLRYRIGAGPEQCLETGRIAHATGEAHAHTHDSDRLTAHRFGLREACPQLAHFQQRALDGAELLRTLLLFAQEALPASSSASSASNSASASASDSFSISACAADVASAVDRAAFAWASPSNPQSFARYAVSASSVG